MTRTGGGKRSSKSVVARKNYVLDTNVVLHEADAILAFAEHVVNLPITVIEEMDQFKKDSDEIGRNARRVSRMLDDLRARGDLRKGVVINDQGGMVRVCFRGAFSVRLPQELSLEKKDNDMLAVCLGLSQTESLPVIFVTKDTNLRIKCAALGVSAEDYRHDKLAQRLEELYTGTADIAVGAETVDRLYREGCVPAEECRGSEVGLLDNQFVWLHDVGDPKKSALGRYVASQRSVRGLRVPKSLWGITARNREQRYALDVLLDDDVKLVTLVGKAGTGKTLLAIAAGLQKAVEDQVYKRLLVSRPVFPMGKDIGFLPGNVQEKLSPWMQPIFDNVDFLFSGAESRDGKRSRGYRELMDMDMLSLEPLTYIRGRSIPSQYLIVDESQNLTPHEVKTIVSRAGEGTKIVLTGDPYQIDNPYVDATSNGLSYCVERFKGHAIAGHVTLVKGERSALAELASNVL